MTPVDDVEVAVMSSLPNPDRAANGGYPPTAAGPTDASFHLYREVDKLDRAIEANSRRMDHLDEHGSRGVEALKGQIEQIRKDFLEHETMHTDAAKLAREAAQQAATARRWMIGILIALVTPLYPLIIWLVSGWRH